MRETKKVEDISYFELLTWLGSGSSHPGGFPTTEQTLSILDIKPGDSVLDAGCGIGLTACYLAKTSGSRIIGIDTNPLMIKKARINAEKEGVSHLVEFKVADVYALPFKDDLFDWVITESVTIFLDKHKVFREFYRILKPQGQVADLELALLKELPVSLKTQLQECFGPGTDPLSFEAWCEVLSQEGFQDVEVKYSENLSFIINQVKNDRLFLKEIQDKIRQQPGLLPILYKNAGFVNMYQNYFGFGLFYGRKPVLINTNFGFKSLIKKIYSKLS
ncbi:MAG: methylase [Gracilibacter sp. BRH_c7a]|nr:MAG: methylase [Gracilibacter sp. BRH_c7a]